MFSVKLPLINVTVEPPLIMFTVELQSISIIWELPLITLTIKLHLNTLTVYYEWSQAIFQVPCGHFVNFSFFTFWVENGGIRKRMLEYVLESLERPRPTHNYALRCEDESRDEYTIFFVALSLFSRENIISVVVVFSTEKTSFLFLCSHDHAWRSKSKTFGTSQLKTNNNMWSWEASVQWPCEKIVVFTHTSCT